MVRKRYRFKQVDLISSNPQKLFTVSSSSDLRQLPLPDDESLFSADTEYIPLPLPKSQKMKRQSKPRLV